MHKLHVTAHFQKDLSEVFAAISDHQRFLSGGGMKCRLIKAGKDYENGLGAVRLVETKKYTLKEEITAFVLNESYDYKIKEINPDMSFEHHNGWLEFTEVGHKNVRVDWHTHFTFTTPIIGHLLGWIAKVQLKKVFLNRLNKMSN